MGIPSTEKYEPAPRGYLRSMFELLRRSSANPVADQLQLWDNLIFNYLIGNTDAHLKNYSLLYGSNMRTIRLAPSYDIISTTVYEQSTKEMALYIGDALSIDDISRDSFRIAAREIGLGDRMAMNHFDDMCKRFCPALHEAAAGLSATGFSNAAQIEARILESGGIRHHL
jgi:serine/threonine-protein kinase HipA